MKKLLIIGAVFVVGLIVIFYTYIIRDHEKLYETVKTDLANKHADYQFIDCVVGERDLVVAYVHVKFKKPGDDKIHEEVWQYWVTDSVWVHRDKYMELIKNKVD